MSNNVYAVLSQNTDILEDAKRNKSAYLEEWKSIPWKKIEQSIYKLQCDIACAEIDEFKCHFEIKNILEPMS